MKSAVLAMIALASTSGMAWSATALGDPAPAVADGSGARAAGSIHHPLPDDALDHITGGIGYDLSSGYGTVTALQGPAAAQVSSLHPFTAGTNVSAQAAASYYNPSFVADGQYTAGLSPYGNGNPAPHVGNH